MKYKLHKVIQFIQENQNGLFKIAVLLIMLYWTQLFCDIAKYIKYLDLSSIETELSVISEVLAKIDLTLTHR